jgi:hypothetical protein
MTVDFGIWTAPANVSRLHVDAETAMECERGTLAFTVNSNIGLISNELFREDLIVHDLSYCTTLIDLAGDSSIPTLEYFHNILKFFEKTPTITDIGCGQGEFVVELRKRGFDAIGFDPVLRSEEEYLYPRYWSSTEDPKDLYVLRCVLPHISDPWGFLEQIWSTNPSAFILIEYQRIEWMVKNSIWNQICHDHIHQFVLTDFVHRAIICDSGVFAEGEWQWVLLRKNTVSKSLPSSLLHNGAMLQSLHQARSRFIEICKQINPSEGPQFAVWGAAAKGAMIIDTLQHIGYKTIAIDSDANRQGKFLESTATKVLSPQEFFLTQQSCPLIIANPRHKSSITTTYREDMLSHRIINHYGV